MITTEEAFIGTLQIKAKIGDHQAIQFLFQIEKEETVVEKKKDQIQFQNGKL